jgi:hypothetical protein
VLDTQIAKTAANPLTYVKATSPPFLFFHGSQDRLVSPSQTLISESGVPWSTKQTMNVIVDFLNRSIGDKK